MEGLTSSNLIMFLALAVPGFLSMRVYGLFHPMQSVSLKESLLEAISFGVVNFALMFWAIDLLVDPTFTTKHPAWGYLLIVLVFFLAPMLWPAILFFVLKWLAEKRIILQRSKNSWDDFFLRRQTSWIIIHLKDGRKIGGWYGENSYASLYPNSGHLYLEELWKLSAEGNFEQKISGSRGLILRPDDYHSVEFFAPEGETNERAQVTNNKPSAFD